MKYFIFPILLGLSTLASAQNSLTYYDPMPDAEVPADAPEWMNHLFAPDVNMHKTDSLFNVYLSENPDARFKRNGTKAIVNFYKRWARAYRPFTTTEGKIVLPLASEWISKSDNYNKIAKSRSRSATVGNAREWKVIGPFSTYDFRTKKITPTQANVYRIDVARTNENTLYCGTETGMVFKSIDAGKHWTACALDHDFGGQILAVAIDPKNEQRVWVGTQLGLWLSTDGGLTWNKPTGWTDFKGRIDAITIDPQDSKTLLVGCAQRSISEISTGGKVFRTTDNGDSFQMVINGRGMDVKFNNEVPGEVYALAKDDSGFVRFHKSTDHGKTFRKIALPNDQILAGRMSVFQSQVCLIVTTGTSVFTRHLKGKPYLLRSLDKGENWVASEALFQCGSEISDTKGGQGYYDMTIAINEQSTDEVYYGLVNSYKWNFSVNVGTPISGYGSCFPFDLHVDIQQAVCRGNKLYVATDGGVNLTNDFFNQHHEVRSQGIYATDFWGFDQGWNEDIMVGGRFHNGDMAMAPDLYGEHSIAISGAEEPTGYVFLSNPRKIAFSDAPDVILPDNKDDEFQEYYYSNFPTESKNFGTSFRFHPTFAQCFLIGRDNTLYITTDDGQTTSTLQSFSSTIRDYDFDRENPNIIYVLTADMKMYKSTNSGDSFEELNILPEMESFANTLAINPNNTQDIWVTNQKNGGVFRSKDGGKSWTKTNEGLTDQFVKMMIATGDKNNGVYAVSGRSESIQSSDENWIKNRISYFDDVQQRWTDVSQGLPERMFIIKLLPFYPKGVLRIASDKGIWELQLLSENERPIAAPTLINTNKGSNINNSVQLESFSIAPFEGTKWMWTLKNRNTGDTINSSLRNPTFKVLPSVGNYDATLKIVTQKGNTAEKTVENLFAWNGITTNITNLPHVKKQSLFNKTGTKRGEPLTLTLKQGQNHANIVWTDTNGRLIKQQLVGQNKSIVTTTDFVPGMYLYRIRTEDGSVTVGKMLIQ